MNQQQQLAPQLQQMWWLVLALVQAAADGQSLLSSLQKEGNQYKNNHTIHHQRYLQQQQSSPVYAIVNNDESNSMDDSLILKSLESIPPNAAETGAWSPLHYFPVVAAHAAVMPNGKVLAYGSPAGEEAIDGRTLVFWDYRQGFGRSSMTISKNHPQEVDNFCSSGNLLADGTFLASGGAAAVGTSKESVLINYQTETSVRAADLQLTRWYGTMTKLGDGQLLITGGTGAKGEGDPSATPEIYNGKEWKLLPGAMSYEFFVEEERLWYPHQWLTNRGTVFGISMDKMWELSTYADGSIRDLGSFKTLPNDETKPNVGGSSTAVMYAPNKIIQVGGNGNTNDGLSSRLASLVDISDLEQGVQVTETTDMHIPRRYADATVLPNGRVFVSGGSRNSNQDGEDAVLETETWNPDSETWTLGPLAAVYRGYHSTAALLANGAVFTSGGGIPGPITHFNQQVYFPPYLFAKEGTTSVIRQDRPQVISWSSSSLQYGDTLRLEVASAREITQVSLIALPSVTHGFDSNQRRRTLEFTPTAVGVDVPIPLSRFETPPGYYYISVLDAANIPSSAVIIALDAAAPVRAEVNIPESVTTTESLLNGSFEDTPVPDGSSTLIKADEIIGWKSLNGEPMEVWNLGESEAADGLQSLELNAKKAFVDGFYQDLVTRKGHSYDVSFFMRAFGADPSIVTERVFVEWNGRLLNQAGYAAETAGEWTKISLKVVGTGKPCRLTLREQDDHKLDDGVGPLIDNVSFTKSKTSKPCPAGSSGTPGKCRPCPVGSITALPGRQRCKPCRDDKTSNTNKTRCVKKCRPGFYGLGGPSCQRCPIGQITVFAGRRKCKVCKAGKTSNTSRTRCVRQSTCEPGFYGIDKCRPCPAGKITRNPGRRKCKLCTKGRFPNASRTRCVRRL